MGEAAYFCALCAPTGPSRPAPRGSGRVEGGIYSKPCDLPGCGGTMRYLGEDRDGQELWLCPYCDHRV